MVGLTELCSFDSYVVNPESTAQSMVRTLRNYPNNAMSEELDDAMSDPQLILRDAKLVQMSFQDVKRRPALLCNNLYAIISPKWSWSGSRSTTRISSRFKHGHAALLQQMLTAVQSSSYQEC